MKVKLDENLPAKLLDDLRAAGHEADTVRDEALAGAPDAVVLGRVRDDPGFSSRWTRGSPMSARIHPSTIPASCCSDRGAWDAARRLPSSVATSRRFSSEI